MADAVPIHPDPAASLRERWIRTWIIVAFVALLGMPVGFFAVVWRVSSSIRKSPAFLRSSAVKDMNRISMALSMYQLAGRGYPTQKQGLSALVDSPNIPPVPAAWSKQLNALPLLDPWGKPYVYRIPSASPGMAYDLFSLGPDGVLSADDIACTSKLRVISTARAVSMPTPQIKKIPGFPTSVPFKPDEPHFHP